MQGKGTVKNPLTVIAIFAGTAEISGTAILPFLEAGAQSTYIWFLMLFPFTLIAQFFITLNWNHKVLYAPSDFKDEDHFINILQKASLKDQIEDFGEEAKTENETLIELEGVDFNADDAWVQKVDVSSEIKNPGEDGLLVTAIRLEEDSSEIRNKETRELYWRVFLAANKASMRDSQMAEKLALEKLENELGVKIEKEMKFEIGRKRYVFDGVARSGNQLTTIEVKFMRDMRRAGGTASLQTLERVSRLYDSLSDVQKKEFSFIFAIVTDNVGERELEFIKSSASRMSFPAVVKVYDFDSLAGELLEDAS
ncbi:MAG: hypothetical protein P1U47_03545 [Zhongshania sp.]|uniref:hypothetical protein n=1 Tax=Zhongshania sp. TaxID=1971902 RepID=UPI002629D59D|nr:hypothetical protein [Zhongshania sp.]MDF1691421.1 hypothetical protein [Zhongshania sp.]